LVVPGDLGGGEGATGRVGGAAGALEGEGAASIDGEGAAVVGFDGRQALRALGILALEGGWAGQADADLAAQAKARADDLGGGGSGVVPGQAGEQERLFRRGGATSSQAQTIPMLNLVGAFPRGGEGATVRACQAMAMRCDGGTGDGCRPSRDADSSTTEPGRRESI